MMTQAAMIQGDVRRRRIGAGLRGRVRSGGPQSSLALSPSRTSAAAGVGLRRILRDVERTYLRPPNVPRAQSGG
jgi:hypothetical protein